MKKLSWPHLGIFNPFDQWARDLEAPTTPGVQFISDINTGQSVADANTGELLTDENP